MASARPPCVSRQGPPSTHPPQTEENPGPGPLPGCGAPPGPVEAEPSNARPGPDLRNSSTSPRPVSRCRPMTDGPRHRSPAARTPGPRLCLSAAALRRRPGILRNLGCSIHSAIVTRASNFGRLADSLSLFSPAMP
ncbi:hypothetical protein CDD83_8918 [Cordyceps sp. RAO-2017]|nr:hypothetical protein CDD83_8918 [Cordyceps sp. RAO-2017]